MILIEIFGLILIADFISGIGHWWEDTYGNPNWKFVGETIIKPNLEHHRTPYSFLSRSYWNRNDVGIIGCVGVLFVAWWFGFLTWQLSFVMIYLSQVNEIHACSHRRANENFFLIKPLQEMGLMQSKLHHGWHHKAPYDCNFCILTDFLNPVLTCIKFWDKLEKAIETLGVKPLRGAEIRGGI